MPRLGFLIDNRKCIGCHACTVACKSEHEVPLGVDRTWVKYIEKGEFPHNRRIFTVMRCNHCDWAPCVTICPVTALYRREDGVVDFNSDRCIGCKACMQACPYDALYIDPSSHTAAKCNFCTHRLERGLEPSCVVVCPEQAIVCGDLDEPESRIAQLVEQHAVQVRKPEKGTRPKLYYIEGDQAALVPTQTEADGNYMWSRNDRDEHVASNRSQRAGRHETASHQPLAAAENGVSRHSSAAARRTYDVRPRPPAWGWPVVAYTWTKSIAAGAFLATVAASQFPDPLMSKGQLLRIDWTLAAVALLFLLITTVLLVVDLKRPQRFLYVLLRPQWASWLVRGAYVLVGFGALLTCWLIASWFSLDNLQRLLVGPGVILAVLAAIYTAFLFAQAKGRDMWQSPLLSLHLLSHALLAGTATWMLVELGVTGRVTEASRGCAALALVFSTVTILCEVLTASTTEDARQAMDWIIGRAMGGWFWGAGIGLGHLLPLALLYIAGSGITGNGAAGGGAAEGAAAAAAILMLACLLVVERLWVLAPQRIPLS